MVRKPDAAAENADVIDDEIGCAALLEGIAPRNYWTWDKLAEYRAALNTGSWQAGPDLPHALDWQGANPYKPGGLE